MDPDLIVVGDVMIDVSVESTSLRRGGDVHGDVRLRPGGSAANAAAWAAWSGARVRIHGKVGDDLPGRLLREALAERGVEVALAEDRQAATGTMLVVREAGERSMVADRGANARLSSGDLPERLKAGAVLVSGYLLFHSGSEPAARAALQRADTPHLAVEAASWPLLEAYGAEAFLRAAFPATIVLANDREARALTGLEDPEEAAAELADRFGGAAVKLGDRGAILAVHDPHDGRRLIHEGGIGTEERDPTGAGDAFDGVLLARLARGAGLREALRDACSAGAREAGSDDLWPER